MPLDIGLGIIGAVIFSAKTGVSLGVPLLTLGIVFALLPDIDSALHILRGKNMGKMSHEHRNLLHYPLFFLPLGFLVIARFSVAYAWFFAVLVLLHFIHDSIGIGWGVQWFYPISKRYFKFFTDDTGKFAWKFKAWTPAEQKEIAVEYGKENWIRDIYFKLTPIAVVEYGLLILAVVIYFIFR